LCLFVYSGVKAHYVVCFCFNFLRIVYSFSGLSLFDCTLRYSIMVFLTIGRSIRNFRVINIFNTIFPHLKSTHWLQENLEDTKVLSQAVNQRMAHNTMTKRKKNEGTKWENKNIYKMRYWHVSYTEQDKSFLRTYSPSCVELSNRSFYLLWILYFFSVVGNFHLS
jgi:hypothetical protein